MIQLLRSYFKSIIILGLLFTICACDKEGDPSDNSDKLVDLTPYLGSYNMNVNHITGIHSQHDSIGNFLGFGIDTFLNVSINVEINQHNDTDSLLITGLISSQHLNCCLKEVMGVVSNDSISLIREFNGGNRNDYVRGYIHINENTINTNYRWDTSDTWSSEAFPEYGLVNGTGERQ